MNNYFQKILFFIFFFLNYLFLLTAQVDTLYFSHRHESTTKEKAYYVRVVQEKGNLFIIREHYKNPDRIKKEGTANSVSGDGFVGLEYGYNGATGENWLKYTKEYLKDGTERCKFYDRDGKLRAVCHCKDDKFNGQATYYDSNGKIYGNGVFKEDTLVSGTIPYPHGLAVHVDAWNFLTVNKQKETLLIKKYSNGNIAAIGNYLGDRHMSPVTYYDYNGDLIGKCTYRRTNKSEKGISIPINGTHVVLSENVLLIGPKKIRFITEYKEEEKVSEKIYGSDNKLLAEGFFKDNRPYNGYLLKSNNRIYFYQEGKMIYAKYMVDDKLNIRMYEKLDPKNPIESELTFFSKGEVIANGKKKDAKPYEGTFKIGHEIITFKNGKKEGKAIIYKSYSKEDKNPYKRILTYKNNILEGEAIYFDREGQKVAQGIYRSNKPFQGTFIDSKERNRKLFYEEGKKIKQQEFLGDVNFLIFEIDFKDGTYTAYNGEKEILGTRKWLKGEQSVVDGPIWERNFFFNYKNGKKHGKSIQKEWNDKAKLISHYKEGVKDGEEIVHIKNKVFKGYYKDGLPQEGNLLINNRIKKFEKGKKIKEKGFLGYGDFLIFEIDFKDSTYTAYNGEKEILGTRKWLNKEQSVVDGPKWEREFFFNYKNGQRHGKSIKKDWNDKKTKLISHYKEGVKDGEEIAYVKDKVFKGYYKDGLPQKGNLLINNRMKKFKKGKEVTTEK